MQTPLKVFSTMTADVQQWLKLIYKKVDDERKESLKLHRMLKADLRTVKSAEVMYRWIQLLHLLLHCYFSSRKEC